MSRKLISDTHGAPDDSDVLKQAGMFRIDDMAELAVRLGSPVDYNKYGDVIFYDTFEDGLVKTIHNLLIINGYVRIYGDAAKSGGCAAIVNSGTGITPVSNLQYYLHYPLVVSTGFKVSFSMDGNVVRAYFEMFLYDGSDCQQFGVYYDYAGSDLYIRIPGGGLLKIDDNVPFYPILGCFHELKLIVNYELSRYVKLFFDHLEYDLSSYSPNIPASVIEPMLMIRVRCEGNGITAGNMCVDNVVVTQHDLVTGM
jgi:hypothetical protein